MKLALILLSIALASCDTPNGKPTCRDYRLALIETLHIAKR